MVNMHCVEKIYDKWIKDKVVLDFFLTRGMSIRGYLIDYTDKEYIFRSVFSEDNGEVKIVIKTAVSRVEKANY